MDVDAVGPVGGLAETDDEVGHEIGSGTVILRTTMSARLDGLAVPHHTGTVG
jgi:hypothetical protein